MQTGTGLRGPTRSLSCSLVFHYICAQAFTGSLARAPCDAPSPPWRRPRSIGCGLELWTLSPGAWSPAAAAPGPPSLDLAGRLRVGTGTPGFGASGALRLSAWASRPRMAYSGARSSGEAVDEAVDDVLNPERLEEHVSDDDGLVDITVRSFLDVPVRRRFFVVTIDVDVAVFRAEVGDSAQTAAEDVVLTVRGRLMENGRSLGSYEIGDSEVLATRKVRGGADSSEEGESPLGWVCRGCLAWNRGGLECHQCGSANPNLSDMDSEPDSDHDETVDLAVEAGCLGDGDVDVIDPPPVAPAPGPPPGGGSRLGREVLG